MAGEKLAVVIAILVIIAAAMFSEEISFSKITGAADQSGVLEITKIGAPDLHLTDSNINFGSGYVNSTSEQAQIDTDGISTGWTNTTTFPHLDDASVALGEGFILENNGTTFINVTIKASNAVGTFLGGGIMEFKGEESFAGETDACLQGTLQNTYENLTTSERLVCTKMDYDSTKNELEIEIRLTIPNNASTGSHQNTITLTGADVA
jgi:hypothetical protein